MFRSSPANPAAVLKPPKLSLGGLCTAFGEAVWLSLKNEFIFKIIY
jgi:hypothetical protein